MLVRAGTRMQARIRASVFDGLHSSAQPERICSTVNGTTFDTLTAARDLEAAGFDRSQAEALAKAIRDGQGELATKADIARLDSRLDVLHSRLDALESRLNTLQWVIGIQSAITLATFGIVAAKLL